MGAKTLAGFSLGDRTGEGWGAAHSHQGRALARSRDHFSHVYQEKNARRTHLLRHLTFTGGRGGGGGGYEKQEKEVDAFFEHFL